MAKFSTYIYNNAGQTVSNAQVSVYTTLGTKVDTNVTDSTGLVTFNDIPTGQYQIRLYGAGFSPADWFYTTVVADAIGSELKLVGDQIFIKKLSGTVNPTAITLTAVLTGIADDVTWYYYDSGWQEITAGGAYSIGGTNNSELTVNNSVVGESESLRIRAEVGSFFDETQLVKLVEGESTVAVFLSNPVEAVRCDSNGVVLELGSFTSDVYTYLGTNLDTGVSWDIAINTGLSTPQTNGVAYSYSNRTITVSSLGTVDTVEVVLDVEYDSSLVAQPVFKVYKARAGTPGVDGTDGENGKTLRLYANKQTFTFNADGTALEPLVQSDLDITVQTAGLDGTGTWSSNGTPEYFTGTGASKTLTAAQFAGLTLVDNRLEIVYSQDGFVDKFSIYKITNGEDSLNMFLTNESDSVNAESDGTIIGTPEILTDVVVFEGITEATITTGVSFPNKSDANLTASFNSGGTEGERITIGGFESASPANSYWIDIRVTYKAATLTKRLTVLRVKDGSGGVAGPGIVFRGDIDQITATETVEFTSNPNRKDVVFHTDTYYICNASYSHGAGVPWATHQAKWDEFGADFSSVATDILLAQDAVITKGLVMGQLGGTKGFIRSASAAQLFTNESGATTDSGYFLGQQNLNDDDAVFRVGTVENGALKSGFAFDGLNFFALTDNFKVTTADGLWSNKGYFGGTDYSTAKINLTPDGFETGLLSIRGTPSTKYNSAGTLLYSLQDHKSEVDYGWTKEAGVTFGTLFLYKWFYKPITDPTRLYDFYIYKEISGIGASVGNEKLVTIDYDGYMESWTPDHVLTIRIGAASGPNLVNPTNLSDPNWVTVASVSTGYLTGYTQLDYTADTDDIYINIQCDFSYQDYSTGPQWYTDFLEDALDSLNGFPYAALDMYLLNVTVSETPFNEINNEGMLFYNSPNSFFKFSTNGVEMRGGALVTDSIRALEDSYFSEDVTISKDLTVYGQLTIQGTVNASSSIAGTKSNQFTINSDSTTGEAKLVFAGGAEINAFYTNPNEELHFTSDIVLKQGYYIKGFSGGDSDHQDILGTFTALSDAKINSLVAGPSTFGTVLSSIKNGHLVVSMLTNGDTDEFAILMSTDGTNINRKVLTINRTGGFQVYNGSSLTSPVFPTRTLTLTGTANRITVSPTGAQNLSANRTWTLSTPQDIHTSAVPTFQGMTLTGSSSTIGGASISTGWVYLKAADNVGLGLDPNEMYFQGLDSTIGVIGANDLFFKVNATERISLYSGGLTKIHTQLGVQTTGETISYLAHFYTPISDSSDAKKVHIGDGTSGLFLGNHTGDGYIPLLRGKSNSVDRIGLYLIGDTVVSGTAANFYISARENDGVVPGTKDLFNFTNYTTSVLHIRADGNVGIGTTNSTYKLRVEGTIYANDTISAKVIQLADNNIGKLAFYNSPDNYFITMKQYTQSGFGRLDSTSDYHMYFRMTLGTNRGFVFQNSTTNIFQLAGDGTVYITGDILPTVDNDVTLGSSSKRFKDIYAVQTTTGAVFESNLSNPYIKEYETGTVLVWRFGKLIPCDSEADPGVLGVSKKGKDAPIVMGAEPILVYGPVDEKDYLITSNIHGYAKAISVGQSHLYTGRIIGQALESATKERNLIKAMIWRI